MLFPSDRQLKIELTETPKKKQQRREADLQHAVKHASMSGATGVPPLGTGGSSYVLDTGALRTGWPGLAP